MTTELLRRPSLYVCQVRAGARMVPFAGWEMPVQFAGVVPEHKAVRTAAGLFDVSHMGELELRGQYAGQVVNYLITNDASKLTDGPRPLYTCACNEGGTILDDLSADLPVLPRAVPHRVQRIEDIKEDIARLRESLADHHCDFEGRS